MRGLVVTKHTFRNRVLIPELVPPATLTAIGSAMGIGMFLTTLSFLFSTPGWEPTLGGFPALSALVGGFLIKDCVLLGACVWSLGEALEALSSPIRR